MLQELQSTLSLYKQMIMLPRGIHMVTHSKHSNSIYPSDLPSPSSAKTILIDLCSCLTFPPRTVPNVRQRWSLFCPYRSTMYRCVKNSLYDLELSLSPPSPPPPTPFLSRLARTPRPWFGLQFDWRDALKYSGRDWLRGGEIEREKSKKHIDTSSPVG